jgi:Domain of unknown function (DUF4124)
MKKILVFIVFTLSRVVAADEGIFRCIDNNGQEIYQAAPCATAQQSQQLAIPAQDPQQEAQSAAAYKAAASSDAAWDKQQAQQQLQWQLQRDEQLKVLDAQSLREAANAARQQAQTGSRALNVLQSPPPNPQP